MNTNNLKPVQVQPKKYRTIVEVMMPLEERRALGIPDDDLKSEIGIWQQFYSSKWLEKTDRDKINNAGRRAGKTALLSVFIGAITNRLLTKTRVSKLDFLNLRWYLRIPIRLGVFGLSFYFMCFKPMSDHVDKLRHELNVKYTDRMEKFLEVGEPLILNPTMLNEEGMNEDEKEYIHKFYEQTKYAAKMQAMQKEHERKARK